MTLPYGRNSCNSTELTLGFHHRLEESAQQHKTLGHECQENSFLKKPQGNYATYLIIKREKNGQQIIIFQKKMPWYEKWLPVILWRPRPNGKNLSQDAESLGSRWVWKRLAHHSEALAFRRPSTKRNKAAGLSAKGKGLKRQHLGVLEGLLIEAKLYFIDR